MKFRSCGGAKIQTHLESCQTSKIEHFGIFAKPSILDVDRVPNTPLTLILFFYITLKTFKQNYLALPVGIPK